MRKGVDQWTRREVYKLAAREGLKPTTAVSLALRELERERVLMFAESMRYTAPR